MPKPKRKQYKQVHTSVFVNGEKKMTVTVDELLAAARGRDK